MKDIMGYEGYYRITENGAIYSLRSNKWLKPGYVQRRGRNNIGGQKEPRVVLSTNPNDRKTFNVGRLVALTFVSNPNNYLQINHIDGNPSNNHYTNIEWCTQSQNIKHAYNNGLMKPHRGRRSNTKGEPNIHKTKSGKWIVQVWHKSKVYNGGTYADINDAIIVRDKLIANFIGEN